jgi:hypothetical protein
VDFSSDDSFVLFFPIHAGPTLKQVGEIKKRDGAITIDVVHGIEDNLCSEWNKSEDPKVKQMIAEMGV